MKKQIGKLLGRLNNQRRPRSSSGRRLRLELLESRRLLAADLSANHNYFIAEDVNMDFAVTPMDALLVINALNQGGARSFGEGETGNQFPAMLDVNGDKMLTPMDALRIINRLNGEGEDPTVPYVAFTYQVTDTAGVPIIGNNVPIGQTFRINVSVQDVRPNSARSITDPNDPSYNLVNGIFTAAEDLGVSNLDVVSYLHPTSFFSGIHFDTEFAVGREGGQGGGIQIAGSLSPVVSDGQFFSITTASGTKTFEFDIAGTPAVVAGRVSIPLPEIVNFQPMIDATITAIQGAGLGLTPVNRGYQLIGLPNDQFTFDPGNSALTLSTPSQEYLNEIRGTVDRSRSINPVGPVALYSVNFTATAVGSVTFTPNKADLSTSETSVFGGQAPIPPSLIAYGAPFTITVLADATAPVAVNDTLSSPEDTALILGANVTANDTVTSGRTLSIASVSTIAGVTVGSVSGTTYTPPANFFGQDKLTYVVKDSTGLTSSVATITINVTPVNDAPTAFNDLFSVDEGSTANSLNLLADNGSGADIAGPANETGDSITITSVGPTSGGGVVNIATGGKTVIYTPALGFVGTDTFVYTITDSGGLTASATVTIDVAPSTLPRARGDSATGLEGAAVTIAVLANDSTNVGATGIIKSFTNGANGTVARKSSDPVAADYNVLMYTSTDPNFYGIDTFTYVINDSAATGPDSTATVTVTITDVNNLPILVNDTAATNEDTALTIPITTLLSNDSPGLGEATYTPVQTLKINSVAAVTANAGTVQIVGTNVVYTPAVDFNGQFLFTYVAQDSGTPALSAMATVTVNVAAVNDNPIANPDTFNGTEDTTLTIPAGGTPIVAGDVRFNDKPGPATATDEANQTLTVTGVSAASTQGGTVSFAAGMISYTPVANFNGSDTFTYTISDGAGGTATGTVTVIVAAVNDPPVAGPDSISGFRNLPITLTVASLLANDNPGGGIWEASQPISITAVTATADTHGTVVLASDGKITYTPDAGFSGAASFVYTLRDSDGATATGTVSVTVAEFVPSTIQGTIFIDSDGDEVIDSNERRLGGLAVTLTGKAIDGSALPSKSQLTLADGSYSFVGLGPGTYSVSFTPPSYLKDAPGPNSHGNILVNNPAGATISGQNFTLQGSIDLSHVTNGDAYQFIIDQFASSRYSVNGSSTLGNDMQNALGAYFALDAQNTLLWSALRTVPTSAAGGIQFTELVLAPNGSDTLAYLTIVDASHVVTTHTLSLAKNDFFIINDINGAKLIGVRGARPGFETVNRAAPPFTASKYLASVDQVFAERGWDS